MGQRSSIYWTEQTAQQARALAEAKGLSVSALVSHLVATEYENGFEPPIQGTCPTCGAETSFVFLAVWDGLPDGREPFKLYKCNNCQTTLHEAGIVEKEAINA